MIEIVVVLVVAAIVLPAIILPFVEGIRNLEKPVIRGTMSFLAQEEMEKRIISFGNHSGEYDSISGWGTTEISGFPDYSSTGTVDFVALNDLNTPVVPDTGYKRITVTVSHGPDSLSLITVKTNFADR